MKRNIILISSNKNESENLNALLTENHYLLHVMGSVEGLVRFFAASSGNCVILDLDSVCVDNRTIRELTLQYPQVYFLCMSEDRFHPELKDAICYHIYACLNKPLNYDELLYWLKCIEDNDNDGIKKNNNH
ncbi:MAG: hypothetical protein WC836_11735 [Desulfobacula sp.]|jgi:DNA-binding NtrC family response regulator